MYGFRSSVGTSRTSLFIAIISGYWNEIPLYKKK